MGGLKQVDELVDLQDDLDKLIVKNHRLGGKDLYDWKKTALLVELGELANELRYFKFWSKDREPRFSTKCTACNGTGVYILWHDTLNCPVCRGSGKDESENPALEEYVDGLHFLISIGLEIYSKAELKDKVRNLVHVTITNIDQVFSLLYHQITNNLYTNWEFIYSVYIGWGYLLGFSTEEIKEAYKKKNNKNLERQANGY